MMRRCHPILEDLPPGSGWDSFPGSECDHVCGVCVLFPGSGRGLQCKASRSMSSLDLGLVVNCSPGKGADCGDNYINKLDLGQILDYHPLPELETPEELFNC